jgi:hypothetical protein
MLHSKNKKKSMKYFKYMLVNLLSKVYGEMSGTTDFILHKGNSSSNLLLHISTALHGATSKNVISFFNEISKESYMRISRSLVTLYICIPTCINTLTPYDAVFHV